MFDGNTFLPVTGMPIRKMACMSRLFALAEPVPFTVPILNAKSFTREAGRFSDMLRGLGPRGLRLRHGHHIPRLAPAATGFSRFTARVRNEQLELAHVPGGGRA